MTSTAEATDTDVCVCGSDHLCACGCRQEINPNARRAHELVAAGATHRAAAEIIGVSREAVSSLIRKPPRYVPGHLRADIREAAVAKTVAQNAVARSREQTRREQVVLADSVARIEAGDTRFLAYSHWSASLVRQHRPDLYEAFRVERERKRARREALMAQRRVERERKRAFARANWQARTASRNIRRALSLDALMVDGGNKLHDAVASTASVAEDPSAIMHRERLWEIVGDIDPERLGDRERQRLCERLLAEGFAPPPVREAERKRLKDPNRHAGALIAKSGGHGGGKRSRRAQQQVTREHHVRELTGRQKRQHASMRRQRKERFA